MSLPVAILAGGIATRMRPLTEKVPKVLIEVSGEAFVFHQLRLLARNDVDRVIFLLGHLGEQVVEAVGDGSRFGLKVEYVFDGPKLLGTGGAVASACPVLGEMFFVLYGDSYLDCDYQAAADAFLASGRLGMMTVFKNEEQWDSSNVEFWNSQIIAYSKIQRTNRMKHIDYGLGLFKRQAFDDISLNTETDLEVVYKRLLENNQLAAYEYFQRFYEIGSYSGIEELEAYLNKQAKP